MRTKLTSRIQQAMTRLEGGDPNREKATLLIVDDEKGPRESLRMILSPQHRVLVAHDGHEALGMLGQESVDAVTVDLNMPGMKGDVLVRKIRKQYPQTEVIVITGYSSVESAVDGLRHGIFDYLTKPFDVVQVSNTVRRALARRESRRRMIAFLRGIGEVLGENHDSDEALGELAANDELRDRLRDALEAQPETAGTDDEGSTSRTGEFLESLAAAIESREPHRSGHGRRVAFLSGLIAERMGLSDAQREDIRVASFLHDVGRVAFEPRAEADFADAIVADREVPSHNEAGAELATSLGYSEVVSNAVRYHHARFDGEPALDDLVGNAIPLPARIIAVADAFDVLTHDEPGREALSQAEAISTLRARGGSELDPDILKELIMLAECGESSSGPLLGMKFEGGDDPIDAIAAATAWLEVDR